MNCSRNVLIVDQRPVTPCEPPTAWLGGKRHLARRICGVLAATPHDAYCEPFIGMGGVFLRRLGDLDAEIRHHVGVYVSAVLATPEAVAECRIAVA